MDIKVSKASGNDVTLVVTPQANQTITIDRNIKGDTGATGATGAGVAVGGTTGQVLAKASNTNYDTTWVNANAGTVTSVTGTSPIASSGGTTPAISIGQATTFTNGYLSSTDWTTFNNKLSTQIYPSAGIPNSTGSAWGTSYGTTGTGSVVLSNSPTLTGNVSFATDITVNGLTVGKGIGNSSLNTVFGITPLSATNIVIASFNGLTVTNGGTGYSPDDYFSTTLVYVSGTPATTYPDVDVQVNLFGEVSNVYINGSQGSGFKDYTTVMGIPNSFGGTGARISIANLLGTGNIAIGNNAGKTGNPANSIYIGNNTTATNSYTNEVVIGNNLIGKGENSVNFGQSIIYCSKVNSFDGTSLSLGADSGVIASTYSFATGGQRFSGSNTKQIFIGTGTNSTYTTSIQIGSTSGTSTTTVNGLLKQQTFTVATLPTGSVGARSFVTNALSPSLGVTVVGGGAVGVPVYHDGTNWICDSGLGTLSGAIVGTTDTQTLTNKRITSRVLTTTSSATPTINTDNTDQFGLTAQAVDITSFTTNLSGTPTNGQKLWIYIVGTAARAITWGASFESSTATLPTTTLTTNRLDIGFVWNVATSKWRCVAVA